jgi:hypothetical protein
MMCPQSTTCYHELNGGHGSCGPMVLEMQYSQHEDGCWTARIRHPYAAHSRDGKGSRRNVWWIADANNKPHWNFADYDYGLALQIKKVALEILSSIPIPKLPPTVEELSAQLIVAQLKINALEKQMKGRRNK